MTSTGASPDVTRGALARGRGDEDDPSLDAMLRILEGADHFYHVLGPDQTLAESVLQITADWYAEKL